MDILIVAILTIFLSGCYLAFSKRPAANGTRINLKDIWKISAKDEFVYAIHSWTGKKCAWGNKLEKLSDAERTIFCVMSLEAEVNNGGINQFLYNSSGNFANEVEERLRAIGADKTADIYHKAFTALGCKIPIDRKERQEFLRSMTDDVGKILDKCDKEFLKYPDVLMELIYRFIMKNKDNIGT